MKPEHIGFDPLTAPSIDKCSQATLLRNRCGNKRAAKDHFSKWFNVEKNLVIYFTFDMKICFREGWGEIFISSPVIISQTWHKGTRWSLISNGHPRASLRKEANNSKNTFDLLLMKPTRFTQPTCFSRNPVYIKHAQKALNVYKKRKCKRQADAIAIKIFSLNFAADPGHCDNWKLVELATAVNFGSNCSNSGYSSFETRNPLKTQTLASQRNGLLNLQDFFYKCK